MGRLSGWPDLIAVHREAAGARRTIERLSRAGVDGGAIELLGPVEVVTAGRYGDRQTDLGSARTLVLRSLRGGVLGALVGALVGAGVFALAVGPTPLHLLAGAGGGAGFGLSVGLILGLLVQPTMAGSWERTFAPLVPGGVAVGVRIAGARDDRRARRVLSASAAHSVREVTDLDDLPDGPIDLGSGP